MARLLALLILLGIGSGLHAQDLRLPATECKFRYEGYKEYLESYMLRRVRFTGCLRINGDPPREFFLNSTLENGSALQFEHYLDSGTKLQFWVYEDAGATRFNDEAWNRLIQQAITGLPNRYTATVEKPFLHESNSGPAILGQVSIQTVIQIADTVTGKEYMVRYCLAPAEPDGKVMLVGLRCESRHFAYMNSLYDRFVSGLFLTEETE